MRRTAWMVAAPLVMVFALVLAGCGDDEGVSSEEDAKRAYLGLDKMVEMAMDLGFKGFNAASSANIPAQTSSGAVSGTVTVTGKVDQGSSNNKGMRLFVELRSYAVDTKVTYNTGSASPALNMSLKKIPDGTMTGTLVGDFTMTGELSGVVKLNLAIASALEADSSSAGGVKRKTGTIKITGTATSSYGVFKVDVSR